jgi:hypothetical protein
MKSIFIIILVAITANVSIAQSTAIDKLFDRYAYKEGFTTVFISKHMFELFATKDLAQQDSKEMKDAISGLESIKILTVEDSILNRSLNFFNEIGNQIPFEEYTTLMVVKEKNQDLRMMVKEKNGKIVEFLMLGGGSDNLLISIIGEIDLNSISNNRIDG